MADASKADASKTEVSKVEASKGDSAARRPARSGESVVLDASAVLALLYGEPGQEEIRGRIRQADVCLSAVSVCEVSAKLSEAGLDKAEVREALGALSATVHPFDEDLALEAGALRSALSHLGLSLADRAALALANSLAVAVITVDGSWEGLANAEVIRPG